MRNRRLMVGFGAVLLLIAAVRHPSANVSILTHDPSDLAPHQVKAAIDIGVMTISLLVTWTGKRFA